MKLFVDTGAFIALTVGDDDNHPAAAAFYRDAKARGARFLTTNLVLCETMNYLRARVSHGVAVLFWESLKKSGHVEVIPVSTAKEEGGFTIFKQYADKRFSFTDCTSFAVMKALRLKKAFAFDKHLEQFEGITRLP